MFTGLVAELGRVVAVERTGDGTRIEIAAQVAGELSPGDSVAVDGACLTATSATGGAFSADVMEETLRRTALTSLTQGEQVNLELPLRAGDRLGGHMVQGHVDGVAEVSEVREEGLARVLRVEVAPELLRYVVEKGSVALGGVSLTVAELHDDGFSVSLIPETLERTTLGGAAAGTQLNLEVDVLAKYVERLVPREVTA